MTDFATISNQYQRDRDFPLRAYTLMLRKAVLDGTLYDVIRHRFHEENNGAGEYLPLHKRAPCIKYGLSMLRTVTEDGANFTFGEGRFPMIDADDEVIRDLLQDVVHESKVVQVMRDAVIRGSIGSVAILMRVLKNRLFFQVLDSIFLTPEWDETAPDTLLRVTEKYKVRGQDLQDRGYTIPVEQLTEKFWFQRIFDQSGEQWFLPWPVKTDYRDRPFVPPIDESRSVRHNLGFVPVVWIKNLPGGDDIDGASTFMAAVDTAVRIDYQLSQADRALKYSADPLLLLKEPAQSDGPMIRSASNAIVVDKDGDAKLIEINGAATAAQLDFVHRLREYLLEAIHGNRTNADRISAAQSGKAMELLYHSLIQLADSLRASYGEDGLLSLMQMVLQACNKTSIKVKGKTIGNLPQDTNISLRWPHYFPATPHDLSLQGPTLNILKESGIISRETAIKVIAPNYDIADPSVEQSLVEAEEVEQDARALKLSAQVKVTGRMTE